MTLMVAALLASPSLALAQEEDPTTAVARSRFQEGTEHYSKGEYESARRAFLQAYALRKDPSVLLKLGQSCLQAGHPAEAATYLSRYLSDSTTLGDSERAEAETALAAARSKIGRIRVTAPAGSEVAVDGERVGNAPLAQPVDIEPGAHVLAVRLPDGTTDSRPVNVTIGEQTAESFGSSPEITPRSPKVAATPVMPVLTADTTTGHDAHRSRSLVTTAPIWIGAGVGVAGFAMAIAFGVLRGEAYTTTNDTTALIGQNGGTPNICNAPTQQLASACGNLGKNINDVNVDATIANVALGIGIGGTALAVAWALFGPRRDGSSARSMTPALAPLLGSDVHGMAASGFF
jgi:tetratricopeptide (TPR) repeat protein